MVCAASLRRQARVCARLAEECEDPHLADLRERSTTASASSRLLRFEVDQVQENISATIVWTTFWSSQARASHSPPLAIGRHQHLRQQLFQACAAEAFQIVLTFGVQFDRHLVCDPGERNIGLHPAQFLERGRGDLGLSGQAGGRGEHAVGADEIAAFPDTLARKTHCLVVVAPDELGIGGDAVINRRERIPRA